MDRDMEPRNNNSYNMSRDTRDWRAKPEQRYIDDLPRLGQSDPRGRKNLNGQDDDDTGEKRMDNRRDNRNNRDNRRNNRMGNYHRHEEEEPEWFTGGPTSQNEFIELVGFEEAEENAQNNAEPRKKQRNRSGRGKGQGKKDREGGSRQNSRSNTPAVPDDS